MKLMFVFPWVFLMLACSGGGGAKTDPGGADTPIDLGPADVLASDPGGTDIPIPDPGAVDVPAVDPGTSDTGGEDPGLADIPATDPGQSDPGTDSGEETQTPPAGCCLTDLDCPEDTLCVIRPDVGPGGFGLCLADPLQLDAWPDPCWLDSHCFQGGTCKGAFFGTCDEPTGAAPHMGECLGEGCCTGEGQCKEGERCVESILGCVPVPEKGKCWEDEDCGDGGICAGAYLCPCPGGGHACTMCKLACIGQDHTGICVNPIQQGCCQTDADCGIDEKVKWVCAGKDTDTLPGWKVCVEAAPPGWCWKDEDCAKGEVCKGAAVCPCWMDCDMDYEGPGICVPADGKCAAIQESWVKEYCDAANLVIFDGEKCKETCPGCCECRPFCDYVFQSIAECQAACVEPGPGVACTSHATCPSDQVCVSDFEGPARECGLCGKPDSCHCGVPAWPSAIKCANDQDCKDNLPCGEKCLDCPDCPKCVHGWCVYETFESPMCICTGCA